jgi:hypothetical protein
MVFKDILPFEEKEEVNLLVIFSPTLDLRNPKPLYKYVRYIIYSVFVWSIMAQTHCDGHGVYLIKQTNAQQFDN